MDLPDAPAPLDAPSQTANAEEDNKVLEEMLDAEDSDEEFSSQAVPQDTVYILRGKQDSWHH